MKEISTKSGVVWKKSLQWHWLPITVLFVGMFSVMLLIWINHLNKQDHVDSLMIDAIMDIEINATVVHFQLEKAANENAAVDVKEVMRVIDEAITYADAIINTGETEHGRITEPLDDPDLRPYAEVIRQDLMKYKTVVLKRLQNPWKSEISLAADQQMKAVLSDIIRNVEELDDLIGKGKVAAWEKYGRLFVWILIIWIFIIFAATAGLWNFERRRKKAAAELKKSEENLQLYQALINQSHDSVEVLDPETGNFLNVNKQTCTGLGYNREELLSMKVFDIDPMVKPSDFPKIMEALRKTGDSIWNGVHMRKDGSTFPVEVSLKLVQLDRNYLVAVARDVTERKKMEDELYERVQIAQFQSAIGTALAGSEELRELLQKCAQSLVDTFNGAFARIWTLNTKEQVLELQASAGLYTHLDGPHSRVPVGKFKIGLIAQERKPHLTNQVVGDPRVGDQEWAQREGMVAFAGYPLLVEDRVVGIMAMFARHTLTERHLQAMGTVANNVALAIEHKRAEAALRESEELYTDLFNGMLEGFALHKIICDEKGNPVDYRFLKINPAFERLTGLRAADLIGRTVLEVLPNTEPFWIETYGRVALTGESIHFANYSSELKKHFMVTAYCPRHEQFVAIFEDITERKKAEKERDRLNEQLEERNKELQQIVYTVSHDLRSPLINIRGYSRMLADYLQKVISAYTQESVTKEAGEDVVSIVDKDIPEAVSYISASITKMDSLLSAMLKFSRSASIELNKAELDMNVIIREVLNVFDFQIKEAGARCDMSELPSCYGDAQQINQVFSNLIGNSIKFLSPGSPGVIRISGRKEDGQVIYCVEDNGIGMLSEEQGRIFDIFYRGYTEGSTGEGIGLAIVKKIIERHNGKVWVESEVGKGSKFYVALPG